MRFLIIHNPASGPRSDEIFAFAHALSAPGDEIVMRFIGVGMEPEDATSDAASFDRIVVSGGDGSVSNMLNCLRNVHVPILVFPSGTANLFFNNIGNAPEAAALAKACRAGRTVKADMGEMSWVDETGAERSHGFIIIAGTGFDATIMQKAEATKGEMGEIAYMLSALATPSPQVAHFTIECDGETHELDGIGCMVGNTSVIQNEINLFPGCRMNDGLIDIAVIEPPRRSSSCPRCWRVCSTARAPAWAARSSRSSRRARPRSPARPPWACSSMASSFPATPARSAPGPCPPASTSSSTSSPNSAPSFAGRAVRRNVSANDIQSFLARREPCAIVSPKYSGRPAPDGPKGANTMQSTMNASLNNWWWHDAISVGQR